MSIKVRITVRNGQKLALENSTLTFDNYIKPRKQIDDYTYNCIYKKFIQKFNEYLIKIVKFIVKLP